MVSIEKTGIALPPPAVIGFISFILLLWQGMVPRSDFVHWISLVGLFSLAMMLLAKVIAGTPSHYWWWGMLLRAGTLCYFPNLSDDYLRFLFDGHLTLVGLSPFAHLPTEAITDAPYPSMSYLLTAKNYYSVYPPAAQALFSIAAYLGNTLWSEVLALKLLWLTGEGLVLYMLPRLATAYSIDVKRTLWYTLHPLVIIEGVGNLHLETWSALAFTGLLLAMARHQWVRAAIWLAVGISVKLLPLLALPIVVLHTRKLRVAWVTLLIIVATWLPMGNWQYMGNILESLQLYVDTFSFHASLFYWVKLLLPADSLISAARILTLVFGLSYLILLVGVWRGSLPIVAALVYSIGIYLLTATTVNPWYLIPLLAIQVVWPQRWLMVWSATIFLSYHAFMQYPYREEFWLVVVSYIPVYILLIAEVIQYVRNKHTLSHQVEG